MSDPLNLLIFDEKLLSYSIFGCVKHAKWIGTQKSLAVKLSDCNEIQSRQNRKYLTENPEQETSILQELQARGGHRNIICLFGAFYWETKYWQLMEYCAKGELFFIIANSRQPLPLKQIKSYFLQLLSAVEFIHQSGFAHLDISLENILITEDDIPKLCDFGLACSTIVNSKGDKNTIFGHGGKVSYFCHLYVYVFSPLPLVSTETIYESRNLRRIDVLTAIVGHLCFRRLFIFNVLCFSTLQHSRSCRRWRLCSYCC